MEPIEQTQINCPQCQRAYPFQVQSKILIQALPSAGPGAFMLPAMVDGAGSAAVASRGSVTRSCMAVWLERGGARALRSGWGQAVGVLWGLRGWFGE